MRWFLYILSLTFFFNLIGCSDSPGTSPIDPGDYMLSLECGEEEAQLPITVHVDWDKALYPITIEETGGPDVTGKILRNEEGNYDTDSEVDLFFFGDVEGAEDRTGLFRFAGSCVPSGDNYECEGSCFGAVAQDDEGREIDVHDARLVFARR